VGADGGTAMSELLERCLLVKAKARTSLSTGSVHVSKLREEDVMGDWIFQKQCTVLRKEGVMSNWILKKQCTLLLAVAVALISGLASWAAIGASRAEASDTIRIGLPLPLTGGASKWGTFGLQGATIAVNDINDGGGVLGKKIELIKIDTQCVPAEGVSAAQRLLNVEKVDLILGAMCSSVSKALQPVVEASGIPMVLAACSDPEITYRAGVGGFKWTFRNYPTDEIRWLAVCEYAVKKGYKKFALVAIDNDAGRGVGKLIEKYTPRWPGVKFNSIDFYSQKETDFRPILSKIKAAGTEVIVLWATSSDAIQIMGRQMRELGLAGKVPVMGMGDMTHPKMLKALPDVLEGAMEANPWSADWDHPRSKKFTRDYMKMWDGEVPNFLAYTYWETAHLIAQAIKEAGSVDPEALHKALEAIKYESVMGTVQFDDHHQANLPMVMTEISNGKIVIIGTLYSEPDYPKKKK